MLTIYFVDAEYTNMYHVAHATDGLYSDIKMHVICTEEAQL